MLNTILQRCSLAQIHYISLVGLIQLGILLPHMKQKNIYKYF